MTAAKNKNRSLSENLAPSNFQLFANNPPLRGFGGLAPAALIPTETPPEVVDTADVTRIKKVDLTPPDRAPNEKYASVPDPTLFADWQAKVVQDESTTQTAAAEVPTLTRMQSRKTKFLQAKRAQHPSEGTTRDIQALTWRFSVSSINMTQQPPGTFKKKRKQQVHSDTQGSRASVTPEEIMLARKIDGEVGPYTIRHDTQSRIAWDTLVILIVLLDIVFTPISVGFDYHSPFLDGFNTVEPVIFVIDFLIRMFSSYVDEHGILVSGPRRTVPHYLVSGWAIPDFVSWFPFENIVSSKQGGVLSFVKCFRLAKVSHLAYRVHSATKAGAVRLILLFGIVLTISHLLACYWSWVAVDWRAHIQDGTFVPNSLFEQYSLCWSLVIGAINASPPVMYSAAENISIACFMLVGNVLQASVFGSVAALIASFDEHEAAFSKKIIATSERCRFLGIPENLSKRIRGYYENLWRETKSINSDADAFINELSPALICEVKFQLYRDMMKRIPFLSSKTLAPAIIEMLILHLRTVIYMQDDVLIRKGEFGDWMGFIGSKGSVGILDPNSDKCEILCILRKGDYFGEMALLQHTKRSATTVALTWVQIHVLCRQDLDYVKELYPTQAQILEDDISKYKYMQTGVGHS